MVLRNTVWNTVGLLAEVATGFLMAPILIPRLGHETYGVWVILASVVSFLTLFDLGIRATVARMIAFHRAKEEPARVAETTATAQALLGGLGLAAVAAMAAGSLLLTVVFKDIPPDRVGDARLAMLVMGGTLFLTLVLSPYDGALWAHQRFGWLNLVNVPVVMARCGLLIAVAVSGGGLFEMALVTFSTVLVGGVVKGVLAARIEPAARPGAGRPTRAAAGELLGFSVWVMGGTVIRVVRIQVGPILIGSLLGVGLVTPYANANRVAGAPALLLVSLATVLTPIATRAFARGDEDELRRLLTTFGKYMFALSLALTAGLVLLGRPFLTLWVGPALGPDLLPVAYLILVVLAAGEALPNTQWVSQAVLGAAAQYRRVAYLAAAELGLMVLLVYLLVRPFGLLGVSLAVAVPGFLFRGFGLFQLVAGVTGLSAGRYLAAVAVPAAAAVGLPTVALGAAVWWHEPATWGELAGYAAGYGLLLLAGGLAWFPELRAHPAFARAAARAGRAAGRPPVAGG